MADLLITQITGMNDGDAPSAVGKDQCVSAVNVEFAKSQCGERRGGSTAVTITGSGLENKTHLTFLGRYLPSEDETAAELIAFACTPDGTGILCRKDTSWHTITQVNTIDVTGLNGFKLRGVSIHGKFHLAFKSSVNRLHIIESDGTMRRSGMATPGAAPTGANTAGAGTFFGTRYYRTRETVQVSGTTVRRSEPSAVLTFSPAGNKDGVTVTKPADAGDSATHWELEASLNNADFYRIATTVVGTTTATDNTALATGYAAAGTLSEDVGDYTVFESVKFLLVDNDRLIGIGHHDTAAYGSRVVWSTVTSEPGVGNDERVPIDTNNVRDVDATDGGDFTDAAGPVDGIIYLAKRTRVYRMVRTGERSDAYDIYPLSTVRGALEGSLVAGVDQSGSPCVYMLDPNVGPCRASRTGLRDCSGDIHGKKDDTSTWQRVNINAATVVTRVVFYPDKAQVHWWVAVDGGDTPTLKIVLQTNKTRDTDEGVRGGFSLADGNSAKALCTTLFASNVNDNAARNLTLVPLIGVSQGGAAKILRLDTGTTDDGTAFFATVVTRPYMLAGILNKFGVMAGAVLAKAASGVTLFMRAIRDFGVETSDANEVDLTPVASEDQVVRLIPDYRMATMAAFQLEFGDDPLQQEASAGAWEVNQIAFKPRPEETS